MREQRFSGIPDPFSSVESLAAALRVVLRATAMLAEHGGKQEQQQRTQKESVDKEQASSVHECEIT